MEVLSNLLHGLSEAIQIVQQQVDQIVERERRAEAERERRGEAERDVNPTPSSSSSEESRETAARSSSLTSDSSDDTNQTSETGSDVTVQSASRTDSDSTHTELSRAQENNTSDQDLDPYEIDQLLEAMRSQSRSAIPIESDVISTRSARLRSPPPSGDEHSTAPTASAVEASALEWDDVSTARVAPSEENLLACSNSPALVANPVGTGAPELPANNDDIPTAIEADN